jgi:hypothetical protein
LARLKFFSFFFGPLPKNFAHHRFNRRRGNKKRDESGTDKERSKEKKRTGMKHGVCRDWDYIRYTLADGMVFGPQILAVNFPLSHGTAQYFGHQFVVTAGVLRLSSVSQPPGRGPVPGPGINYTGPRESVISVF